MQKAGRGWGRGLSPNTDHTWSRQSRGADLALIQDRGLAYPFRPLNRFPGPPTAGRWGRGCLDGGSWAHQAFFLSTQAADKGVFALLPLPGDPRPTTQRLFLHL